MRLQLALCLLLAACGGSKPKSTMPETSSTTAAPSGAGEPAEAAAPAAEPVEASKAEAAMAPGAPAPLATPTPKRTTRGATTKPKKSDDPDAGGE